MTRLVKSTLKCRADLPTLFKECKDRQLTIAEVGVYKGDFSQQLLDTCKKIGKDCQLCLIDPWNSPECEGALVGTEEDGKQLLEKYKDQGNIEFIKDYSQTAAHFFYDESLMMVYLDAEHTYDGVLADLSLWWPKVSTGGILAGHDIFVQHHIGVTQALLDFFTNETIFVVKGDTTPEGQYLNDDSWYVIKG